MPKITKEAINEELKKNLIIVDDKKRTPEEINSLALQIVKDIKKIVESIILNETQKVKKDLYEHYKNYICLTKEKLYSLHMFNEPNLFFEELQKYTNSRKSDLFNYNKRLSLIKNDFNNSFSIINFSILKDLLIKILGIKKNAYEDDIIKSDISIIVEVITSKVKRITKSITLFLCFVNELREKYKIKLEYEKSEFIKKVNSMFKEKEKAKEKYENIKRELFQHIKDIASLIIKEYNLDIKNEYKRLEKVDSSDYSKIDELFSKIKLFGAIYKEIKDNQEKYKNNLKKI